MTYKQKFISDRSEGWKSEVRMLARSSSGRALSQVADCVFFLYSLTMEGSKRALWGPFYNSSNPIHEIHPHDLITSQRPCLLTSSHWRLEISVYEF